MGAPVITKAGNSYVSRMSTAVLAGCGLHDWIATDERHYVKLAVEQAANLHQLTCQSKSLASSNSKESAW